MQDRQRAATALNGAPIPAFADWREAQSLAADFDGALDRLLAPFEQLVFQQFRLRLFLGRLGFFDLGRQFADGSLEVVAPRDRGARVSRVGEVIGVADPRALFLIGDFAIEIDRHAREFGDHQFDLPNAPALLLGLETLQPNERVSRFHLYALHTK